MVFYLRIELQQLIDISLDVQGVGTRLPVQQVVGCGQPGVQRVHAGRQLATVAECVAAADVPGYMRDQVIIIISWRQLIHSNLIPN